MNITIKTNELLAMYKLASHDESRWVLNSVMVEQSPDSGTLLVATDGRRLGVLKLVSESDEKFSFLIPRTLIERFMLLKHSGEVTLSASEEGSAVEATGFRLRSERILEPYPNWRQVLPKGEAKQMTEFSATAQYYDAWHEIAKLLGGSGYFAMQQTKPMDPVSIILHGVDNFYGLLMPAKSSNVTIPEWVKTL